MIDLSTKSLTLLCAASTHIPESVRAFNHCAALCRFTDAVFITHEIPDAPVDGRVLIIPTMRTKADYEDFILDRVWRYVDTERFLTVQWDGFVVNPDAWDDEFVTYDYTGAPWHDGVVGNSGCCIRSRELARVTSVITKTPGIPNDVFACQQRRGEIEALGLTFAPESVAARFSWEQNKRYQTYAGQFGVHLTPDNRSAAEIDRWLTATRRKES